MADLIADFTAWADREFGPAPDPSIPQTERFASFFECWKAASASQQAPTGSAEDTLKEAMRLVEEFGKAAVLPAINEGLTNLARFADAENALRTFLSANLTPHASQQAPALPQALGARVEGDTVVIKAKGGNDGARELCGALVAMIEAAAPAGPSLAELVERFKPWNGPEVSGSVQRQGGPALSGGMGDKNEGQT